jgi:hypothetical protein
MDTPSSPNTITPTTPTSLPFVESPTPTTSNNSETTQTRTRSKRIKTDKKILLFRPKDLISVEALRKRVQNFQANYATKLKANQITEADLQYLQSLNEEDQRQEVAARERAEAARRAEIIQIPNFKVISESEDITGFKPFKRPKRYIQYQELPYDLSLEYNLTDEDQRFLTENLPNFDPLKFEKVMALASRLSIAQSCTLSVTSLQDLCKLCQVPILESDCCAIVQYFEQKVHRKQLIKERKIEDSSSASDSDEPGIFVRNEVNERILQLEDDYQLMFKLRQDFERLRILMEVVRKREALKTRKLRIERELLRRRYNL